MGSSHMFDEDVRYETILEMPYFGDRERKRPKPTTDSGVGDHCVDGVRNPTERKYSIASEMQKNQR